jgi:hypothetical protein
MQHLEDSGTPVLYIGRTVPKGYTGPREVLLECHFSFLSIFHELIFYSGNILRKIIFVNVSKSSFH